MSEEKLHRARRILGSVKGIVQSTHGVRARSYPADDYQFVEQKDQWRATLTRRTGSADPKQANLPYELWDTLHIQVGTSLVFAIRFHNHHVQLIKYSPGEWEEWFGTFDRFDREQFP